MFGVADELIRWRHLRYEALHWLVSVFGEFGIEPTNLIPNRVTRDPSATLRPVCNARPGV